MLGRRPDSGLGNIHSSAASPLRNIDWLLLAGQVLLTVAGFFVIYSSTYRLEGLDEYTFVTRQVMFGIVASVVMVLVMSLDYEWLKEHARVLCVLGIIGVMVQVAGGGIALSIGPAQLQPSEFVKATTILALAALLASDEVDEVTYPRFVGGLLIAGIPAALLLAIPDAGGASVLVVVGMAVLWVAGAKFRYIVMISLLGAATIGAILLSGLVRGYQLDRFEVFFGLADEDVAGSSFQVTNAIRAVGTGGLTGQGWLEGRLTNNRDIPVVWADFPFAAIGEQFGFVGAAVLFFLFALVLFRIWRIAHLSKDRFGTYVCAGVFGIIVWQMFQNVGMTIGIMPVTGLPMPFISYGGSGLITYFALFGVLQSIHMRRLR